VITLLFAVIALNLILLIQKVLLLNNVVGFSLVSSQIDNYYLMSDNIFRMGYSNPGVPIYG